MKIVYRTTSLPEARMAKLLLDQSGIESKLHDEHFGAQHPTVNDPLKIYVLNDEDIEKARKIIRDHFE